MTTWGTRPHSAVPAGDDWTVTTMLVLERCEDEALTITTPDGTVIVVLVTKITGARVKLGIDAPPDYRVDRVG